MRKSLIFFAAIALAAAVTPSGSAADSFDCGDVIKESIKLDKSLANCDDDGLIVGASKIVIDLGGHTVDGEGDGAGIFNEKGFRDVVIRNGVITGFEHGVLIDSPKTTANVIDDLELFGNDVAIAIDGGADGNTVSDNAISGNDDGIFVVGSDNVIDDNEIFDDVPAISVEGSDNEITDNEIDFSVAREGSRPAIVLDGDGNLAEDNEVLAGEVGIEAAGDENLIEGNELEGGGGDGIVLEGDDNQVSGNDVKAYGERGITLVDGAGNLIADNEVEESGDEGILIDADETRVEGNQSDDNGNDGIQVEADDVRIVDNSADDNGYDDGKGYGILADGDGVEGADNDARGNANPKECAPAVLCD